MGVDPPEPALAGASFKTSLNCAGLKAQEERLQAYCSMARLEVTAMVREEGVSGAKPLSLRPGGKKLLALAERFVDLAAPFRSHHVVLPKFRGSFSMKAVLPAVSKMTYEGMGVGNGQEAQNAYKALLSGKLTPKEDTQLRNDLIAYCGQDTLAMVKVLDYLKGLS